MTANTRDSETALRQAPSSRLHSFAVTRRGTSIAEAIAFYEHIYDSQNFHIGKPAEEGFSWRYHAVGDDQLVIGTSTVRANRWGTVGNQRIYNLAWTSDPGIVLDTASREAFAMPPGVPVMYPAGRAWDFRAPPATQHLIRFDATFLESVSASRHATAPGPLRFRNLPHPERVDRFQRIIQVAAPALLRLDIDPERRATLNLLVAEAVIETFSATPHVEVPLADGPPTLRLAQEWIVANAHRRITTADLCDAVSISPRALQATFHRHVGSTPMAFLRHVRLHRVRAQLTVRDPSTTTVAKIAQAWGFTHLGRFAGQYADVFGERPSETLRN